MRRGLSKHLIIKKFIELGISSGDTVFLSSNIVALGKIEKVRNKFDYCETIFEALLKIIGKNGTLVVPSYTNHIAREGKKFILEKTQSNMGVFAEHIRKKRGSVRSIHPVNSLVAFGKEKKFICKNNSTSDFGMESPFDRLKYLKCKMISLGLTSAYTLSILHYIEASFGVPYRYNKLLGVKTFVNGKEDKRPFLINARYLDLNLKYDHSKWVELLYKKN